MPRVKIDDNLDRVYRYVREYVEENGYPPSVREIGSELHIKSTASVYYYLNKLEEQGKIRKGSNKNRAIELTGPRCKTCDVSLGGRVQAGIPITAIENIEDVFTLPADLFRGSSDDLFMLTVQGESMMEAGILDGDLIIVRKQPTANNGDIVVAMIDGEVTVKRFYKKSDHFVLHPENSSMEDIIVRELEIVGLVTGLIRSY